MLASFCIGQQISHSDMLVFGDKVRRITDNTYFITTFIEEQYGRLSDKSRPHIVIKHKLAQLGIMVSGEPTPEKPPKKKRTVVIPAPVNDIVYFDNAELNKAFTSFLNERRLWKKPATDHAVKLLMTKLDKISGGDIATAIRIIEKSITSRWTDFYPLKDQAVKANKQDVDKFING